MNKIQKSLLDFCISLFNHFIQSDEIHCLLVIALAVLGVTEKGFHSSDIYPLKLSAIFKISRFFVLRYSYEDFIITHFEIDIDLNLDLDYSDFLDLGLGH